MKILFDWDITRKEITRVIPSFKSYKPLDEIRDDSADFFKIQITPSDGYFVREGGGFSTFA